MTYLHRHKIPLANVLLSGLLPSFFLMEFIIIFLTIPSKVFIRSKDKFNMTAHTVRKKLFVLLLFFFHKGVLLPFSAFGWSIFKKVFCDSV